MNTILDTLKGRITVLADVICCYEACWTSAVQKWTIWCDKGCHCHRFSYKCFEEVGVEEQLCSVKSMQKY